MIRTALWSAAMIAAAVARTVPNDPTLDRHGRIVNGDDANSDAWPWFVSLQTTGGFHFCGGSLVAGDVVMTAAHCVAGESPSSMRVVIGAHNLDAANHGGIVGQVQSITSHPQYNDGTLVNDIALIKLTACTSVQPIPWDTRSESQLFADFQAAGGAQGGLAAIIGLGALSSGGSSPRILQEARQTVMTHAACQSAFGNTNIDAASMICGSTSQPGAGFGDNTNNVDTCQGDSGGPFVTPNPNFAGGWLLTGLTSWGFGCADATPGVYCRVSNYAGANGWIESNLQSACGPPPPSPPPSPPTQPTPAPPTAPPSTPPHQFPIDCSAPVSGNTGVGGVNSVSQFPFQPSVEHHFTFTVPASGGQYVFSTCGAGTTYDSYMHIVSAGNPTTAIPQLSNDDACGGLQSQLSVTLPAGDYKLILEGYANHAGQYSLTMSGCTSAPPPSPPTPPPSNPTPPPSPPTPPPSTPSAFFRVISASTNANGVPACSVSPDGRCFTDGTGRHDNDENCVIEVLQSATLNVVQFRTEWGYDFVTVNGQRYSGRRGPDGVQVASGARILWSSDESVTRGGFEICA
eukprot:m.310432 g.310432  ORF g.310432 m.310432 type:complete len:573 (+) comp16378_c0_seq12:780-2498(+)